MVHVTVPDLGPLYDDTPALPRTPREARLVLAPTRDGYVTRSGAIVFVRPLRTRDRRHGWAVEVPTGDDVVTAAVTGNLTAAAREAVRLSSCLRCEAA